MENLVKKLVLLLALSLPLASFGAEHGGDAAKPKEHGGDAAQSKEHGGDAAKSKEHGGTPATPKAE